MCTRAKGKSECLSLPLQATSMTLPFWSLGGPIRNILLWAIRQGPMPFRGCPAAPPQSPDKAVPRGGDGQINCKHHVHVARVDCTVVDPTQT